GGLLFTGYLQEHIRDILPCQAKRAQSVIIRLHPGSNIDSEATMDPTSTSDLRKSNLCINLTRWTVRLESTSLNGLGDPQHPTSTTTLMPISHFLMKSIGSMVHLVTESVSVVISIPSRLSPLTVCLATLPSLEGIACKNVDCFDQGRSRITWKGALDDSILEDSLRAVSLVRLS
ncbi:hypothetical protein PSHT_04443, partial [Puccinia striiformis]